ncbi:MAG: VCBS repeat-containing protein, partial [Anaerolineales bacterium]|nr:VCBS repeat-containing protein [Anaerolineales bacterium]
MSRPVARALFLLSSIMLALLFVILMVGGLGRLTVVAEGTGRSPILTSGTLTARAPFTFTALHNDFYLGGGQIVAVTDLNGDDYPDLVRSGVYSDQTSIWFNDGSGNYYDSQQYFAGFKATSVGDVNFDSLPDLVGLFSEPVSANPIF